MQIIIDFFTRMAENRCPQTYQYIQCRIDNGLHLTTTNTVFLINVKDIYEKVLAEEAIKLCSLLEGRYSLDDVENMFITGGTGIAYYPHIKKYMAEHHGLTKVVLTNRADDGSEISPMYAIVIGLHKQLKNRYK